MCNVLGDGTPAESENEIALDKPLIEGRSVPIWNVSSIMNVLRSYLTLVRSNGRYRLYLLSHICQHGGDWFVHVASIMALRSMMPESSRAISGLVFTKTLPNVLFSGIGGVFADAHDRRKAMIALDLASAFVVLGYLVAISTKSSTILYATSFARSSIVAMYDPITKSIVPMLVPKDEDLKKAVTCNATAWSSMLIIGGVISGKAAAHLGVEMCFVIDILTYLASAYIMSMVRGDFYTLKRTDANDTESYVAQQKPLSISSISRATVSFMTMAFETMKYLWNCGFGILIFLKSSGSFVRGFSDILNPTFSKIEGNDRASSQRLGIIYSCIGIGCIIGPVLANCGTDMAKPRTLQKACTIGLTVMAAAWLGISTAQGHFFLICLLTAIRAIGGSIVWVNSTLLMQKLCSGNILGRVLALEFAFAMLSEAIGAWTAASLQDGGTSASTIAFWAALALCTFSLFWGTLYIFHYGTSTAANRVVIAPLYGM